MARWRREPRSRERPGWGGGGRRRGTLARGGQCLFRWGGMAPDGASRDRRGPKTSV